MGHDAGPTTEPVRLQWYLAGEPVGDLPAELLSSSDLGSQLAGVAALHMGRALESWARRLTTQR
jgi:hypothetical protein